MGTKICFVKTVLNGLMCFLFIVTTTNMIAQDITGIYRMPSGNPEGGSTLVALENGKYIIFYFGGAQIGRWKNVGDHNVVFTPHQEESSFQVYGRKDSDLNNKIRIAFFGFENGPTLLGIDTSRKDSFKKVFNDDANCFGPLHVEVFDTNTKEIRFATQQELGGIETVAFDIKGYNDFIAYYVGSQSVDSFYAVFKENKLFFDENAGITQSDLPEEGEDIQYARELTNTIDHIEKVKYCNPQYHLFQDPIPSFYVFNEEKGAYLDPDSYQEDQELIPDEYDYDDMSIIYAYNRCSPNIVNIPRIEMDKGSVFIEKCD